MSSAPATPAPRDMAELMAQAHALETEAVERYGELADVLAEHNNPEVAAMFRRLASQERCTPTRSCAAWAGPARRPAAPVRPAAGAATRRRTT